MSSTSVSSQISQMQNATAVEQAKNATPKSELTSSDFLNLMMKQLQNQDPTSPQDSSQFLSQQAQFTQLSVTEDMNSNIAKNNSITQATSLVGKTVILTDPDNAKKTITGVVQAAEINGSDSAIVVGNKSYSLKYLKFAYDGTTTKSSTDTSGSANSSSSSSGTSNSSSSGSSSSSSGSSSSGSSNG